jgi:Protein of unknown function (DUF2975)
MKPLRAARTAGVLKDLLDVLYWAIVILAPVYAALVAYGYARGGRPGVALVADVWFEPSPGDWALQGAGERAAELVDGVGRVRFQRLPWPELTVLLAAAMLRTLLWLPILYQLRKLLGALRAGRPFVRENTDRLRKLGWSVILVQLALAAIRFGESLYVALRFRRPGLQLGALPVDLPTTGVFVGAVLLVAAEAFRRGAQLEEDQAFTV